MKKIYLLFFLITCYSGIYAQKKANLSANTRNYLAIRDIHSFRFTEGYVYKTRKDGHLLLSALIKLDKNIDLKALQILEVEVGTQAGDIWTVRVPEQHLKAFSEIAGILYIQLDEPIISSLDEVRKQTHVDSVQKGIGLPNGFTGKNVVIGIMDIGFDYTHPSFFDTTGAKYRIKRVWEQKTTGTPPAGFLYGNEISDTLAMWAKGTDNNTQSHGTHVTGIAAGSGFGSSLSNSKYRGMAFNSDIVLVGITPAQGQWQNTGMADIIDGMQYIFTYAQSVGKPAVANLSWGCTIGPHDGSSLFSQACDNLTGKGKIFVCSAGNTGDLNLHINKTFTAVDTSVSTVVGFQTGMSPQKTWVDIWGDTSQTFCVKVSLYNGNTMGKTTQMICIDNNVHSFQLIGSNMDTCFVTMTTASSEFNMKPHVLLNFYSRVNEKIVITIQGNKGKIDMWNGYVLNSSGYYGAFTNGGYSWAISGNTNSTISDMASTKSAIAVGAYASKTSFTNVLGGSYNYNSYVAKGNIVPFSSHGPTIDYRVKPDITAPGLSIASAINSFDASFKSNGSNYLYVVNSYYKSSNAKTYSYAMMSGTSMSSPAVSGISALLLEADPNLDPQSLLQIFRQSALKDAYTGTISSLGSNIWGAGKINAYQALKKHLISLQVLSVTGNMTDLKIYPNPSSGNFALSFSDVGSRNVKIELYNGLGEIIYSRDHFTSTGLNTLDIDLTGFASGIYLVKMISKENSGFIKLIVQ